MQELRDLRLEIDKAINTTQYLQKSREVSLCHTELQRSKMWLGKCLAEVGTPNPYPESTNPKNPVIEPQAEHGEESYLARLDVGSIANEPIINETLTIKSFRAVIQELVDAADKIKSPINIPNQMAFRAYFERSAMSLMEAKMWLGWALDEIRKKSMSEK